MRIFKMMLVMIVVAPLAVFGENLEYNYIEDNLQNKIENRAKPTTKRKIRKKSNLNQTQQVLDSKKKKIQQTINDRKEANGPIIGAGWATAIYLGGEMNSVPETITTKGKGYSISVTSYESVLAMHNGFDVLGGYKWFFGQGGFGMRLYGEYIGLFNYIANAHTIALNYDLLFNWVKTRPFKFGMILGLGVGAHITDYRYKPASNSVGSIFGGNFGFRFIIYDKYAIEVLVNPKLAYQFPTNIVSEDIYYGSGYTSRSVWADFGSFLFTTTGNVRFVYTF